MKPKSVAPTEQNLSEEAKDDAGSLVDLQVKGVDAQNPEL
eukprot:CAMPEP_0170489890 /NCGR_PEP_ID=MMETSP0208-20121228/8193_1 /TAXON_ID=197538 /ORGANISM="Strombidium inclinatum, Strain S3" /LENGTH=39 /DNA_ID= /DNA_START= /DNA_END= /DNA_ORIENTATION=